MTKKGSSVPFEITWVKLILFVLAWPFAFFVATPVHEFGHYAFAHLMGLTVVEVDWFDHVTAITYPGLKSIIFSAGGVIMEFMVFLPLLMLLDKYRLSLAYLLRGYFYIIAVGYLLSPLAWNWVDAGPVESVIFVILSLGFWWREYKRYKAFNLAKQQHEKEKRAALYRKINAYKQND